jgi:hypothetical protein
MANIKKSIGAAKFFVKTAPPHTQKQIQPSPFLLLLGVNTNMNTMSLFFQSGYLKCCKKVAVSGLTPFSIIFKKSPIFGFFLT